MIRKKEVKLIFKDTLDVKNLYLMQNYLKNIIKDSDCVCYHFFEENIEEFEKTIKNFLSSYCHSIAVRRINKKPSKITYLVNYLKRLFFFLSNSFCTTSSLQKSFEYLFFPRKLFVYRIKLNKKFLNFRSNLKSTNLDEILHLKNSLVIFFRSDSIHNTLINLRKDDIVVNLIRNLDTPFLKGPPTVKGKYVLNIYYPMIRRNHLAAFKGHKCIDLEEKNSKKNRIINYTINTNKINVLYAMSQEYTSQNELYLVKDLKKLLPPNINFKVKLHGSNPAYYYNYLLKLGLIDDNLRYLEKPDFSQVDVYQGLSYLSNYEICMGLCTTFFLDAYRAGIKHHLYIADLNYFPFINLYYREHLQILFKFVNAKKINSIYQISDLINNLIKK